ncbi:MAG: efflux transporter outer membrane subunit [Opitutales bacterium]|nr:efflux transporter outer membrane subunit [Opitutales bacterium]
MFKYLSVLPFLAVATACTTMAPDYERPDVNDIVAETYAGIAATTPDETAVTRLGWSEFFADERLKALIKSGLEKNRDLRVAILTVEQIRARYDIQWAELLPNLAGNGAFSRSRTNEYLSPYGKAMTTNTWQLGVAASYEVDLWGRVRSMTESALENWLAAAENERAVRLSLVAQIALQYYTLELANERLVIAQKMLTTTKNWYDIMADRFEKGAITEIDLSAAEAQYQSMVSSVQQLTEVRDQAKNSLAQLVGETELPQFSDVPALPLASANLLKPLDAGIPSFALVLRPDVLAAERALRAANANIGAARAAFFPSIALTGTAGLASVELDDLFTGAARTWSFVPSVNVPIFDYFNGRLEAQLDVAELQKEIEIANYEKAIQNAFREVADELVVQKSINARIAADEAALKAQARRYELSAANYRGGDGVISYTDVLLAQNDFFAAQQNILQTRFAKIASMISLYKALGGGWTEQSVPEGEKVASAE